MRVLLKMFLFLLPWQTIWIFREVFVGGMKREYLTLGFYATEALLWVVIMMFIIWYWKNYKLQITNYKFRITKDKVFVFFVLLFIVYCLLSRFWSLDSDLAMQQSLRILEAFLLFFVILLGPLKKEEAIKWLVLGSILPCILGIWQFLAQSTFASTWLGLALHPAWQGGTSVVASETIGRWLRAYGPFSHPNVFGGYIVIVLVLMQISNFKFQNKIALITSYLLLITSLFFTFSRSAWVAVIVSCILYLITCNIYQRNKLHVTRYTLQILLILILTTTFFPLVQTRFTGNSVSESHSITDRVSGYSDAWKLFKQHPVLGVGAGNYTLYQTQPAHNAFALFAVEGGVVGVGLLVIVFVSCILYLITYNLYQENKLHVTSYTLQVISFIILASFDHYFYSSYIGLMLSALFFGLVLRRNGENTVSPQLVHRESFDTTSTACHNTPTPRLR